MAGPRAQEQSLSIYRKPNIPVVITNFAVHYHISRSHLSTFNTKAHMSLPLLATSPRRPI